MDQTNGEAREVLALPPDAIVEVDSQGAIERVDPQAERLFGWSAQDLVGRRVDVLVADRRGDPEPLPTGVDVRLSALRRDGSQFPAEIRLSGVPGRDTGPSVTLAIRDTTPPMRRDPGGRQSAPAPTSEPPLAQHEEREQEQEQSATEGAADLGEVAHGINNVLSVMLIYSELIERAVQGRSMDEYLAEIRGAAERGAELTRRLRTLARAPDAPDPAAAAVPDLRADEDLLLHAIRRHAGIQQHHGTIGVVVVDDHRMFAEGLARLLALEDDVELLGIGATGREAVTLVEQLQPRVLVLDFDMPEGNGVVAAREVKARWPETMIVMISGSTDDRLVLRAVEAGCSGYLSKDRAASEVADAVRTVAAGEALLSPAQMARLLPRLSRSKRGLGADLSDREREVLELLARGAPNAVIAEELCVSVGTIRDDVQGVLTKLGAHSKLEAVATSIREGVIDYNSPF